MLQGCVLEIVFSATVVECNFYYSAGDCWIGERQVCQPIVHIEPVAAAGATPSVIFTAAWLTVFCSAGTASHDP